MADRPVREWDLNDVQGQVRQALKRVELGDGPGGSYPDGFSTNKAMIEQHNYWLDGYGWSGQRSLEPQINTGILAAVKPMFTPEDVLGELVGNVESGLLEREASIDLTPKEEEEEDDEAEEERRSTILHQLALWWDQKKLWTKIGLAVRRAAWSGRGPIRLRISAANLVEGRTLPTGLELEDALSRIEVDALLPDQAAVVIDLRTERAVGLVLQKVDDRDLAEIWTVEGQGPSRVTQCRVVNRQDRPGTPVNLNSLSLGGRIPVYEIQMDPLVTEPERRGQGQINFMKTVLSRTVEAAGFKSRYMGNVEPPLTWLEDPPRTEPVVKTDTSTGRTLYGVRAPWIFGATFVTEMLGVEVPGAAGQDRKDPTITIDEPTDTAYVTNALDAARAALYKAGRQGHLAGSSTVQLSGDAYEQARAQFEADLKKRKASVEGVVRDLLETVIALAALMTRDAAGLLDRYRLVVNLHVNAGPIRPDQARTTFEAYEKRLVARETAMSRYGIEDTAAEIEALDADVMSVLRVRKEQAAAVTQWIAAGAETLVACWLAEMDTEEAEVFATGKVPGWEELEAKLARMREEEERRVRENATPPAREGPEDREGREGMPGNMGREAPEMGRPGRQVA